MIATRLSNGNWKLRAEPDDLAPTQRESLLTLVVWAMEDCSIVGEEYCLSNFDMAVDLFDYYTGKFVRLIYSEIDKLADGLSVICRAREPEYSPGDLVDLGDCAPYEIRSIKGSTALLHGEDGIIRSEPVENLRPYID